MIGVLTVALALGQAANGAPQEQQAYEAAFRPLRKSERTYAKAGPAGPYYPQRAYDARRSGSAIIRCRLVPGGELRACKPIAESPTNSDFAAAARAMAEQKRIYIDGDPPAADAVLVRVTFAFGAPATVEP